ncbi:MAG: hypothetical protein OZSIB_2862 [Candidatus Ozemobacter sibiricus]|uniref:Uncharacterized protein n=1 Tax=Candidatus Ozemobacter sibiricus TaxID=2268124 RepID=A0A367ZS30_9BACT|nr:MAG: hypothetical protein OZSIB_2862 [Candidatus Ozemobacter sibiricus]
MPCKSCLEAQFVEHQARGPTDATDNILGGAFEMSGRVSGHLCKQEMQIDSCFTPCVNLVMDVADADILLQNPEDPLQLPSVADEVAQSYCFHAGFGGEIRQKVRVMDESDHENVGLEGRDKDGVSLIEDAFLAAKFPIRRSMKERRQLCKKTGFGSERPINVSVNHPIGGELAYQVHPQLVNQSHVLWRNVGCIYHEGAPLKVGLTNGQERFHLAKCLAESLILVQRRASLTFGRWRDDSHGQDDNFIAVANHRRQDFDVDPGDHLFNRAAVEQPCPPTQCPSGHAGKIVSAQGDRMSAPVGGIFGMPSLQMGRQPLPTSFDKPAKPASGRNRIKTGIQSILVDVIGLGEIKQAVTVEKPCHGSGQDQPPVNRIGNHIQHRRHSINHEFEVSWFHTKPPFGSIVGAQLNRTSGASFCTASYALLQTIQLLKPLVVPLTGTSIKVWHEIDTTTIDDLKCRPREIRFLPRARPFLYRKRRSHS